MGLEDGEPVAPSPEGKKEFSTEVQIDGLPFIFKGQVSPTEKKASISLHIANWQEEVDKLKAAGALHFRNIVGHGEVGSVDLTPSSRTDADVYFGRIRSFSDSFVESSPYHGAHIGRFLMNNILTIADANGWRVEAFPYTDGRLDDRDVIAWLERKGFEETDSDFVRQPQTPDATQPVLGILNSGPKKA